MWYYTDMAGDERLIRKMKQGPKNIRFEEVDGLLRRQGFEVGQPEGGSSHYTYRREDGINITVVKPHGNKKTVHPKAIRQILGLLEL
jgi:predicted RNA binding protein YcfA (HicA-like mRNA interferase family)